MGIDWGEVVIRFAGTQFQLNSRNMFLRPVLGLHRYIINNVSHMSNLPSEYLFNICTIPYTYVSLDMLLSLIHLFPLPEHQA